MNEGSGPTRHLSDHICLSVTVLWSSFLGNDDLLWSFDILLDISILMHAAQEAVNCEFQAQSPL